MEDMLVMTERLIENLRTAQRLWGALPVSERASLMHRAHILVRRETQALLAALGRKSATASLTSEILPLLAAMKFAGREASEILGTRRISRRHTPFWLWGTRARVERRAHGVVLIIGPGNYPLMLPGIQLVQALVAGNAVAIKPAPGKTAVMRVFIDCLYRAGIAKELITLLDENAGPAASRIGFDLIVLTGSEKSGRSVALAAAETLTPTIMELSGADPVFVLPGANITRVVKALAFGATLNDGATCIAPRRVFALPEAAREIENRLIRTLSKRPHSSGASNARTTLAQEVEAAGGRTLHAGDVLLCLGGPALAPVLSRDLFEPWLGIIAVASMQEALAIEQTCRFALGSSIFGPEKQAQTLAHHLPAGSICINDLIVPTADPRLPFGGARSSGYGVTRGREGLLAMTRPVAISVRRNLAWHLI